jgi:hypothetical protein
MLPSVSLFAIEGHAKIHQKCKTKTQMKRKAFANRFNEKSYKSTDAQKHSPNN